MTARRISVAVVTLTISVLVGVGAGFWLAGYRLYVVHTGSMEPTLMPGDLAIDRPVAAGQQFEVGQVITFRHSDLTTDVVTHRFVGYTADGLIRTKGDANATADAWEIHPQQVKGITTLIVPNLGYLIVFLKQPAGLGSVVTIAFGLMLLWGLFFPASIEKVMRHAPAHRRPRRSEPLPIALLDVTAHESIAFDMDELERLVESTSR